MGKFAKEQDGYMTISSKQDIYYTFAIKEERLREIWVEEDGTTTKYYFEPKENQQKVTRQILKNALKSLLGSNPEGFDILHVCFYGLKGWQEYLDIATEVFKEYWNKLYNLVFANDVFGRETSLDSDQAYDFFKDFADK